MNLNLSIIIPALNEGECIGAAVSAAKALAGAGEVIVVDGGSGDDTAQRARSRGARVIASSRGRGAQLHAGALAAAGDVLWFLHADTTPPPDAVDHIKAALADPRVVGGNFAIVFRGDFFAARFLTRLYRRLAWIGLRYGDSAYFVRREPYFAVGGFRHHPIFEDLDLLRRLRKRGRFVRAAAAVTTSARRFENRSFTLVFARWAILQVLYWVGVPPATLGRWYHDIRLPGTRRSPRRRAANLSPEQRDARISPTP